jgi:hypothetical protein
MKRILFSLLICGLFFTLSAGSVKAQKVAIYSYPVEIELNNDQGDMDTKEYLKSYGTKGKKRGNEFIYEKVTPFLMAQLNKSGLVMLNVDTLNSIKSNEYGKPSATLAKAVATGIAEKYMKVYIKDITAPLMIEVAAQDPSAQSKKLIKIRCRIQIYDAKKELIKDVEGVFQSGDKIENAPDLGVDLRKYSGTEYLQELKVYETCTKMAVLRAVASLGK